MSAPTDPPDRGPETLVDLARERPFSLAHLTATPASLGVAAGGWSARLEPRAMQVLVVLAKASPEVVGRRELNRRIWGGRIVGEDAINRAVQTLRRTAAEAPSPTPFTIETIPRVGYKLMAARAAPDTAAVVVRPRHDALAPGYGAGSNPDERARRGGSRWLAALVVGLAAVVGGWFWCARDSARPWRVAASAILDDLPPGASDVAPSPDGKHLAYRGHDPQGHERVFVRAADGDGAGEPVSPPGSDARRPAWSRNGGSLAFVLYDAGHPCRLVVQPLGGTASQIGTCETARDPHLAWSADARSLLFGDAPGWNAVPRVTAVTVADGQRTVLSSPPGDSLGDDLPVALGTRVAFRRQFASGDEGWIAKELATGRERLLWRRRGVIETTAASLPDGTLAIAWTKAGTSQLDFVDGRGGVSSQSITPGLVTAINGADRRLLIDVDRSESALTRASAPGSPATTLARRVRGRVRTPVLLPGGGLRFASVTAGMSRLWHIDPQGSIRRWGGFVAPAIAGLALSPDARSTAALVTERTGREIVVFDGAGKPFYRWHPRARSLNPAAWSSDGRHLIVPVLDGAGWRMFRLDLFGGDPPRDLALPGFATVLGNGSALYGVRAGETTGSRELWRLDGQARRLPIDVTLLDIVNWLPVDRGIWLPDRSDRDHPALVLRDYRDGRVVRRYPAPDLAGPSTGLAADDHGPVYVRGVRDEPENILLTLSK